MSGGRLAQASLMQKEYTTEMAAHSIYSDEFPTLRLQNELRRNRPLSSLDFFTHSKILAKMSQFRFIALHCIALGPSFSV